MKEQIPFIVYEDAMVRAERTIKRLWVLCIIMFTAFVVSNGLWIYYESQFQCEETTQTVEQDVDTSEGNAIVSGIGDIYGTYPSESND